MMAMKLCVYHQQVRALQRAWPCGHNPEKKDKSLALQGAEEAMRGMG